METAAPHYNVDGKRLDRDGRKWMVKGLVHFFINAIVLFASAGTLQWPAAWAYLTLAAAHLIITIVVLSLINPELINVRGRKPRNTPRFDKIILTLWIFCLLTGRIIAGLDAGRWRWSDVPFFLEAAGFLLVAAGGALIIWSMAVNRNFEPIVRIQHDRGHTVCQEGPYRLVRHPGYTGIILAAVGGPLLLGSWPAPASGRYQRHPFCNKDANRGRNSYGQSARIRRIRRANPISARTGNLVRKAAPFFCSMPLVFILTLM